MVQENHIDKALAFMESLEKLGNQLKAAEEHQKQLIARMLDLKKENLTDGEEYAELSQKSKSLQDIIDKWRPIYLERMEMVKSVSIQKRKRNNKNKYRNGNKQQNKFIVVSYALYDVTNGDNGEEMLIERTTDERPFIFISGMGVTLPAFEEKVVDLAKGEEFDFQLDPEQAYGQHYDERVLELDKQIFTVNGQFDAQHVQVGAIIPLQNEDGNHFNAVVKNISDTKVTCDLNHPLAGLKLNFCGQILESREATAEEIAKMAQMISGEGGGCSGGCENCGGDCKDGNCEGGCEGGCNK